MALAMATAGLNPCPYRALEIDSEANDSDQKTKVTIGNAI